MKPLFQWLVFEIAESKRNTNFDEKLPSVRISVFLSEDTTDIMGLIFYHLKMISGVTFTKSFHEVSIRQQICSLDDDEKQLITQLASDPLSHPLTISDSGWMSYEPSAPVSIKAAQLLRLGSSAYYEMLCAYRICRETALLKLYSRPITLVNSPIDNSEQAMSVVNHMIGGALYKFHTDSNSRPVCNLMITNTTTNDPPTFYNHLRSRGRLT